MSVFVYVLEAFPPSAIGWSVIVVFYDRHSNFGYTCSTLGLQVSVTVRKRSKIRNRYNQAPHLTQDTNGKATTSLLDFTNESQEVSPFAASDHKASISRQARNFNKNKTEIT